jgi:hypothetical protein
LFKPVEIIFGQATVTKQVGENEWKSGVPVVVPSVDLPPTLGQPIFQIPQIKRFLDPAARLLAFRMRASSSSPSALSKALRATTLSA